MSIDCRCDECGKIVNVGETTVCQRCYSSLLDEVASLKEEIKDLQRTIEEARDE
jgi:rRNA maturation endonuclease Nob1